MDILGEENPLFRIQKFSTVIGKGLPSQLCLPCFARLNAYTVLIIVTFYTPSHPQFVYDTPICDQSHQNDAHVGSYMFLIWQSWNNLRNAGMALHLCTFQYNGEPVYQAQLFHSLIFKWIKLHHY